MILNDKVDIKVSSANFNYWKNKKYDVSIGNTISVTVDDIPSKSSMLIECVCDECGRNYTQRRYRNLDVCGYCITSKRLLGNTLGIKNTKHFCSDIDNFKLLVNQGHGKQYLANHFNVSILTINRWLKENCLTMRKYQGRLNFKTEEENNEAVAQIKKLASENKTVSEICKELKLTRQVVKYIIEKQKINVTNNFKIWQDQYDDITKNIDFYIKENRSKTLNEISNEYSLSIEQLKKAFRDHGVNPKIHSYNKSKGELECRDFIRSLKLQCDSYRFEKLYEIDCFVSSKNFGVEYCGEYWHRYDPISKNKSYHKDKTEFFAEKNIKLMTIFENEWKNKKELLKSMIKIRLGIFDQKIFARKCNIKFLTKIDADTFHSFNHISGKTSSSLNYGLYHKDELVSVLSLIKSRFDKNYEYEISRFSSKRNVIVVGGLSKLFKHFIKSAKPKSCMTYADLRFGEGKSYEKIGFKLKGTTAPNYHYYHSKVGIMESRMKYQKSKLKGMPEYSVNKTEFDIMRDAGYFILFDCGNRKYGWEN